MDVNGDMDHSFDSDLDEFRRQLDRLPTKQQVMQLAHRVLEAKNVVWRDQALSSDEIWESLGELGLEFRGEKNTFRVYLSQGAREFESSVTSTGRGRGGGYYLSELAEKVATTLREPREPASVRPSPGEAVLYSPIREWLLGQGYQTKVTANMRGMGKWSNPDITGLRVTEHLGRIDLEIATIEVKPSLAQWDYWFFEAVAHRRFANRAYFAFPIPEELAEKLPEQLRYMCELYQVGAIVIILSNDDFTAMQTGTLARHLSLDDVSVQDIIGAPNNQVPLMYQKQFCEALQIGDLSALFTWA